jgi:hypothetical protein
MQNAILKLITERQHISMVELCREIPGFKGDRVYFIGTNTVIWHECSDEAVEAMNSVTKDGKVVAVSCSPWVYITDGVKPEYPLAASLTEDFKTPHWLPVVFSTPEQARKDGAK